MRSQSFFIQIANRITEAEELPIVKGYWTRMYHDQTTVLGHESLHSDSRRMYLYIGE